MPSYHTNPNLRYRYRLNENFIDNCSMKQIEGIHIGKEWTMFYQVHDILYNYIKTFENPKGQLDYECFDAVTGEIFNSSINNFRKLSEGKFPSYKKEVLAVFKRPQLQEICDLMNINTKHKNNAILVQMILEKQNVFKEMLKNK